MLKSITLENFKSFKSPQTLTLKKINTIFGANSAGKSSLVHALLLSRYAFQTGVFNAHRVADGVNLGGFHSFVNGQSTRKNVVIKLNIDISQTLLERNSTLIDVEFQIGRRTKSGLVAIKYSYDNIDFVELKPSENPSDWLETDSINLDSPLVKEFMRKYLDHFYSSLQIEPSEDVEKKIFHLFTMIIKDLKLLETSSLFLSSHRMAKERMASGIGRIRFQQKPPPWLNQDSIPFARHTDDRSMITLLSKYYKELSEIIGNELYDLILHWESVEFKKSFRDTANLKISSADRIKARRELFPADSTEIKYARKVANVVSSARLFTTYLSECVIFLQSYAAQSLDNFTHLGPLRIHPDRIIEGESTSDHHNQTNGEAAWQRLTNDESLLKSVNNSLKRLGIKYMVIVKELYDINTINKLFDSNESAREKILSQPNRREILLKDTSAGIEVRAQNVGVGVSQVLPVVVSLIGAERFGITSIEQPELHLHPKLQTELADIFIQAANQNHIFILETHSEHLLLRLTRRIRESSENPNVPKANRLDYNDLNVVFASNSDSGTTLQVLEINSEGEFVDFWPDGFMPDRNEEIF